MASTASRLSLDRLRTKPLRGQALAAAVVVVWVLGAIYCSGYEALSSGLDNWPGSLGWSAAAVLPWLALFEWSKSAWGRRLTRRPAALALALVGTAAGSLLLEFGANALAGSAQTPLALALMRRLPAIGASLLLIVWARGALADDGEADSSLEAIAASIDWLAAADNYIELNIGGRIVMRRMTLREAERALAGRGFVRIHRRYLVNGRRIAAVTGNGDQRVRLAGGAELPVGRRFAANLRQIP
jgi:hypothetical protein